MTFRLPPFDSRGWLGSLAMVAALVALGGVAACGNGGTEPMEDGAVVSVTVRADGVAQSGVTVRLYAASSQTSLESGPTGANGMASFSGLAGGGYEVEVVVPEGLLLAEGEAARKAVTVADGGTASVSFELVTDGDVSEVVEIHLTSANLFDPSSLTIPVGTTVRWVNDITRLHTITPSGHSEWSRQEMTSAGQTFTHTFNAIGTFNYFCEPHESAGMTGTITVE